MKVLPFFFLFLLILPACKNNAAKDSFSDCKYGRPEAIFEPSLSDISNHQFSVEKNESIEDIQFKDGRELRIMQSGCDRIKQEFHFKLPGDLKDKDANFWLLAAVNQFKQLSALGPNYAAYDLWAQAIARKADEIKLAQETELEAGFTFTYDRIISSDHAILMLTLSEME